MRISPQHTVLPTEFVGSYYKNIGHLIKTRRNFIDCQVWLVSNSASYSEGVVLKSKVKIRLFIILFEQTLKYAAAVPVFWFSMYKLEFW